LLAGLMARLRSRYGADAYPPTRFDQLLPRIPGWLPTIRTSYVTGATKTPVLSGIRIP